MALLGMLLPWLIATIFQVCTYMNCGVSKGRIAISSILTLTIGSVAGVALWYLVPGISNPWQKLVLCVPNTVINTFAFVPVVPMTVGVFLVAIPVTIFFTKLGMQPNRRLHDKTKKRTKIMVGSGSVLLCLVLLTTVAFYFRALVPMKRFSDPTMKRFSDPTWHKSASQTERAEFFHHLIDRHLDGHLVWLHLRYVGNKASIPRLLEKFDASGALLEDGGSCVADHCLDALRSITGHDEGRTASAWRSWWDEEGSKLPEEDFYPRAASNRVGDITTGCVESSP